MGETGLEKYLGSVLDAVAEGIEIIDADGYCSFANLAAERMFGPREGIIGRRYDDTRWKLTTPDGVPIPPEAMPQSHVMRTGEPVLDALFGATLPDGRQVVLTMNAVPFPDELFETDHDHVAVLIGDVEGKGIAQAMLGARAKHTMHAYLLEGDPPALVLERTNRVAACSTEGSTFITAFAGLLDKRSGVLEYSNAGHPDPFVLRSGGAVERLTRRSPLLGVFPETQFEPAHASLAAGDVLLMYTDGVTEARGPGGLFGDERIASLLARSSRVSVGSLADNVLKEVEDYASGALCDDVAIMALERVGGARSSS